MKKISIFRKVSAVFLSACTIIASVAVSSRSTANAENPNTGAIEFYEPADIYNYPIYLDKVRDLQSSGVYNYYDNGFFLCDINNDDMPELFVTYNTEEEGIFFAGSIYNGELVTFAEMMGAGGLRTINLYDNGYIGIGSIMQSIYGTSFFRYNGGADMTTVISVSQDLADKTYTKYLNDNSYTITETEYKSILNQYAEASYKAYPIPMPYIQDGVTYNYYFDYYEASEYDGSASTLTIPSAVNGLPVTQLGPDFLCYNSTVKTLNLPASMESYYYAAFICNTLEVINVDSNNPYWISKNGVLYSKDMTTLAKYPPAKDISTYTIPSTVTDIYKYAFAWCSKLKQITLPETIDVIWQDAFFWCQNLSSVTILNPYCYIEESDTTICNSKTDRVGNYLGVIRGYEGSTAQEFADYCDITFISLGKISVDGDCNNDGNLSITDAVMLQKFLLGKITELTNWENADLYEDGQIDVFDMVLMRKLLTNDIPNDSVPPSTTPPVETDTIPVEHW